MHDNNVYIPCKTFTCENLNKCTNNSGGLPIVIWSMSDELENSNLYTTFFLPTPYTEWCKGLPGSRP